MGFLDEIKAFVHSITTDDHYASYDSPYKNSAINNSGNIVGTGSNRNAVNGQAGGSRLHELNRLTNINNDSSLSLVGNNANVSYRPGFRSSQSNVNLTTDLSLQNLNALGQPPLPLIDSMWDRIENWIEEEYPELDDCLNDGVTTADLNEFENDLGSGNLPVEFRQFYKRHDGQFRGGKPTGLIMGMALLDLEGIVEEYAIWCKVAERLDRQRYLALQQQFQKQPTSSAQASAHPAGDATSFMANQRSIPPNSIQSDYFNRGWIPFLKDEAGNQIALDLAPGSNGVWGQIIIFGRDFDTKLVIASSFSEFIYQFVSDLDKNNYEIDSAMFNEETGFLSASRNDDYMIGDEDEDQGELSYYDRDGKEFGKGAFKGRVSYLEVLKRRALKKYGLTENYNTKFTPPRPHKKQVHKTLSGANTPLRAESPATVSAHGSKAALINLENNSVLLPKETLIDDKKLSDSKPVKSEDKADVKEKKEEKKEKKEEEKKEDVKEEEKKEEEKKEEVKEVKGLKKSKKSKKSKSPSSQLEAKENVKDDVEEEETKEAESKQDEAEAVDESK